MIGSIIGDIVGSIYEFHNIKTKEFPLFSDRSDYTDDSILSIATAKWILEGASKSNSGRYYYRYGTNYPHPLGGYGLTSSLRTPKIFIKEFSYFLMPCHQHCLGVNLLVQR